MEKLNYLLIIMKLWKEMKGGKVFKWREKLAKFALGGLISELKAVEF